NFLQQPLAHVAVDAPALLSVLPILLKLACNVRCQVNLAPSGDSAMPRGIPNKKAGQAEISKMEAVRRALADLGPEATASDIQGFVKSNFQIDMETGMISSYKSSI